MWTTVSVWLGVAIALVAWCVYRLGFDALGVVVDARAADAALALVGLALAAPGLRRRPAGPFPVRFAAAVAASLVCTLVGGLLLWDLFLAYRSEQVRFSAGGITLAGTIVLPTRGAAPFPAVVLTHGAGKETRKEGEFYARLFARRGIAALAYDKRGSGESGGDEEVATYQDLAADARAAFQCLASRSEIDRRRIGLWGVSEGAWVVPIAAAEEDFAFAIVVSATAETPAEQVRHEVGERVRRAGYGSDIAARATELYSRVSEFERSGQGYDELKASLRTAAGKGWFAAADYLPAELPTFEALKQRRWYPAWRANMDFDAPAYWRRVRCPVLALLGGDDPKIDPAKAERTIREALRAGGNPDVTVQVFPRAGHGIVEWWLPGHLPPPRFADRYLPMTVDWTLARVSPRSRGPS